MKAYILFMLVLAVCASADLCSDTDDGPQRLNSPDDYSLATKATVRYGLQDKEDTCLTSEMGVSTSSGRWLKEYYCDVDEDMAKHRAYDCLRYGFTGCENGACIGKDINVSQQNQSSPEPIPKCGNKIVDDGEECDPPGSICFGKDTSEYGQCTDACMCKLAKAVPMKCGNGVIDEGESCESDGDCESWEYCKNCICVSAAASNDTADNVPLIQDTAGVSDEIDKKYPSPEIHPVEDVEGKNFTDDEAIKTTGSIARFFIKLWDWFIGLFS